MVLSKTPRVLSIQSHVVSGYCGNRSATFPLQLLELEVDVINTVQLSNHTQYDTTRGQIFKSNDIEAIHTGLKENKLLPLYDNILSGYVADVSYIESMAELIKDIKMERSANNLDCWYTFDPVLGDDSTGYYVPNGVAIAESYKKNLIPLADIITPNRFEASILSGVEIDPASKDALNQAIEAINVFHGMGMRVVVITSFEILDRKDTLTCIVSHRPERVENGFDSNKNLSSETWMIQVPKLDCPFTGTGDLFAALLTGWLRKTNFDFKKSFENTANTIHEILIDTLDWCQSVNDGSVHSHELRLVQNKTQILCPKNILIAENLEN